MKPTEPFTPDRVEEAVKQARSYWALTLTDNTRDKATGGWIPYLLAKIDAVDKQRDELWAVLERVARQRCANKIMCQGVRTKRKVYGDVMCIPCDARAAIAKTGGAP